MGKGNVGGGTRLSSYQKLKQKNEAIIRQLTSDIKVLVEEKDGAEIAFVKKKWRMRWSVENSIMFGDAIAHKMTSYGVD